MLRDQMRSLFLRSMLAIAMCVLIAGILPQRAQAQGRSGAVYVLTNQSTGNSVMVFRRAPDGTLSLSGSFSTGGSGVGTGADPLGSQGALVLGAGHRLLFAVDAGSNEISEFAVQGLKLLLLDKATCWVVATGNGRYAYTANAATATISSYSVSREGVLSLLDPTAGITANGSVPTDLALSSDSRFLYVREGGDNSVSGFRVESDGILDPVGSVSGIPAGAQGIAAR